VGEIDIRGGTIIARGGEGGAGIGAGYAWYGNASVYRLFIADADIHATAGRNAAGIGAGQGDSGNSTVQIIEIESGTIVANALEFGAGIGTAWAGAGGNSSVHNLTIDGGLITANGYHGSGIGTGYSDHGNSTIDLLKIRGATIDASARDAAGIGTGYAYHGNSTIAELVIAYGNIHAQSFANGAGIGTGYGFFGNSSILNLTMLDPTITAIARLDGPGIGTANGWMGTSHIGTLTIDGGHIHATGHWAAGVGAGNNTMGDSTIENLIVRYGRLIVTGDVGFGSTAGGTVHRLEFDGSPTDIIHVECISASRWCFNATTVVMRNAWMTAMTNTPTFIDPVWGAGSSFGEMDFIGRYRVRGTTRDSFGTAPLLHIGAIEGFDDDDMYTLDVRKVGVEGRRSFQFNGTEVVGFIFSIDGAGTYEIAVGHHTNADVKLCPDGGEKDFVCGPDETLFKVAAQCGSHKAPELSAGAKAAISIGVITIVAAIAVGAFFLFEKCVRKATKELDEPPVELVEDPGSGYTKETI
jgi:hypothetical protein